MVPRGESASLGKCVFSFVFSCLMENVDSNEGLTFSCSRMPHLFTKDIALVQQLFEALCKVGKHLASVYFLFGCSAGSSAVKKTLFLSSFTGRAGDATRYSRSIIHDGWSLQYFGRRTADSHGGTCGLVFNKGRSNCVNHSGC